LELERIALEEMEDEEREAKTTELDARDEAFKATEETLETETEEMRQADEIEEEERQKAAEALAEAESNRLVDLAENGPPLPRETDMFLALRCAQTGCYLSLDSTGSLAMFDQLGFQASLAAVEEEANKPAEEPEPAPAAAEEEAPAPAAEEAPAEGEAPAAAAAEEAPAEAPAEAAAVEPVGPPPLYNWVGAKAMEFEYVEYKVTTEPAYDFGMWRGLPNALATVDNTKTKWAETLSRMVGLNLDLIDMAPENRAAEAHPAAAAGLQISFERFGQEPNSWPRGGGGAGILHPGAVSVEATELPYADKFEECRVERERKIVSMMEILGEMKEIFEQELQGNNCAAVELVSGRPEDGAPPKTGSLEHIRALHHPSAKAVGFIRALLVLLGEPQDSLGSWAKCRPHLCFRDQRNPWRNIHQRLESFDPRTAQPKQIEEAAELIRKMGAEAAARKEYVGVYLVYKWIVLMLLMNKTSARLAKFAEKPKRPRMEPGDLPLEPVADVGADGDEPPPAE